MKKLLIGLAVFFCLLTPGFAQIQADAFSPVIPERKLGIRAGLNVSNMSLLNHYLGYHAAIFGDFRTTQRLGFSSEIAFSRQGCSSGSIKLTTNYISVPLLLNFYTGKFTWQAGGYSALLLKARTRFSRQSSDATGAFSSSDFGLVAGLKMAIIKRIGIGIRYYSGLKEISGGAYYPFNSELYTSNWQISVNYDF